MTAQLLLFGDYDDKLPQTKKVLSLFSGCGGMDLGMEGGFTCLKKSINLPKNAHWISEDMGRNVLLKNTDFITLRKATATRKALFRTLTETGSAKAEKP